MMPTLNPVKSDPREMIGKIKRSLTNGSQKTCSMCAIFWLSIKKAKDCLFSRRNGYSGKIIFGYSIRLRLFNKNII